MRAFLCILLLAVAFNVIAAIFSPGEVESFRNSKAFKQLAKGADAADEFFENIDEGKKAK
ncbi:hypothetical protein CCR75_006339 [Bremia lactucae]|uniref:Uncharacterized protein n=1 Tax=Bremia lactucae TaxID=4779 RepID=A0A976FQX7_BRELC|nr:hypothetical protein CCR75_006339 [Bremia lactucae]